RIQIEHQSAERVGSYYQELTQFGLGGVIYGNRKYGDLGEFDFDPDLRLEIKSSNETHDVRASHDQFKRLYGFKERCFPFSELWYAFWWYRARIQENNER